MMRPVCWHDSGFCGDRDSVIQKTQNAGMTKSDTQCDFLILTAW